MNIWTEKSIELANQRDYLDQLFKVYPMANNLKRELSESNLSQINLAFNEKDNEKLIRLLLEQANKKLESLKLEFEEKESEKQTDEGINKEEMKKK